MTHHDTVNFPSYALSALIDGDYSGLEETDIKELEDWQASLPPFLTFEVIDENSFFTSRPCFGLACDCVELSIWQSLPTR